MLVALPVEEALAEEEVWPFISSPSSLTALTRLRLTSTKMDAPSSTGCAGSPKTGTVVERPPMCAAASNTVMLALTLAAVANLVR